MFVCSENYTKECFEEDHRYSLLSENTHKKEKGRRNTNQCYDYISLFYFISERIFNQPEKLSVVVVDFVVFSRLRSRGTP